VERGPFVGSTGAWLSLALKKILQLAAEGGYERVAFVTGQQSVDRYGLQKHVERIDYDPRTGNLVIHDVRGTAPLTPREHVSPEDLPDILGKDAAERLLRSPDTSHGFVFSAPGLGIKLGGEGMIAFYDSIVPKAMNKLLSRLDAGRVREVAIAAPDRGSSGGDAPMRVAGFDVTPALRRKVRAGLPLFGGSFEHDDVAAETYEMAPNDSTEDQFEETSEASPEEAPRISMT